ncbi:5-Methylcytosine G/T mismatch-specific DNA glycosylase [Aspergillus heteromorphus CBS 117.55]|uniref:5-Methylcytosine G/T mismatch-specific DNA glycosylase n=1 Tax=Aspergillus heteromorphus CBS 117.55 TaxID=1448321 RepID=A0A317V5C4_9EURO|nr:5-Methylcytosine G/T mismatch-specific DNA glycosylase [Aspergillus heteromorphus CBS 117.55]PWY69503.1 5-Methylcytosine G/T mismatch-specific DNA glycosylase [Aspergillus heteromorphus CBS 117.55]
MFLPLRLNDRDRDRHGERKASSSSTISSKSKQRKNRSSHGPTSRTSTKERDPDAPTGHSSTPSLSSSNSRKKRRSSMPGVDSASRSGTASFLESRTSLPYPSFSKAHSKEAVGKPGIPTPDPTDLTEGGKEGTNGNNQDRSDNHQTPPSPPLTSVDQQSHKESTLGGKEDKKAEDKPEKPKTKIRIRAESTRSSSSLRSKKDEGSKTSKATRSDTPKSKWSSHEKDSPSRTASRNSTKSKIVEEATSPKRSSSHATPPRSPATARDMGPESTTGSEATVAPPTQSTAYRKPKSPEKPPSRTQTRSSMSYRQGYGARTPVDAAYDYGRPPTASSAYGAPPPPPPPPQVPLSIPKVDYLLQNGGLDHRAQKSLFSGQGVSETAPYSSSQPQLAAGKVFDPFNRLLDDFHNVMTKNGSLAVATGYRSVARRLLDRLEAVFARDISSESCHCLMCDHEELEERPSGVSWGEVLELVSGRRELPSWPPFIMNPSVLDANWSGEEHVPMQKLDIDVPEEYRDHFIRQSRKTKVAVDRWLSEQPGQATSAPEEVDDETLTFAILTHLGPDERPLFSGFLGISSTSPTPRPEGQPRPRPAPLVSSSLAIQRMYRLASAPRDPEAAIYMLNNPGMHHVLATLAAISDDEWDILISGRFDGFLRSGAEDAFASGPGSTPPRWSHSRSNTPFTTGGISRGPTPGPMDGSARPASQPYGTSPSPAPASFGGPIALDEEMEIAALAEIERDIYLGMEALEDAFEALHCKAEVVRRALRERGAGLSLANQNRRGSFVEARLGTPASGLGGWDDGADDDFLDDAISLAPDDSASNISSNRRRRPKRRTERRTPAPVEEEDEDEVYDSRRGSRRR